MLTQKQTYDRNMVKFGRRSGMKVIKWIKPNGDSCELVSNAYGLNCAYLNEENVPLEIIAEAEKLMGGKIMTLNQFRELLKKRG